MIKKMMLLTLAGLSMAAIGAKPNDAAENMSLAAAVHDRTMVKEAQTSTLVDPLVPENSDLIVDKKLVYQYGGAAGVEVDLRGDKHISIINANNVGYGTAVNFNLTGFMSQFSDYGYVYVQIGHSGSDEYISCDNLGFTSVDGVYKGTHDSGDGSQYVYMNRSAALQFDSVSYTVSGNTNVESIRNTIICNIYVYNIKGQLQDGQTADVYINVDDSLTIDQILANVSAEDLLGESVKVQCSEDEKAKYNSDQIGTYKITITATDKYGQTATCYLNIHVTDTVGPVIANPKALNFAVGDTLVFADITDYITITDNGTAHGGTIGTPTYKIDGQAFTSDKVWGASDVGNHNLEVSVADSSGNSTSKTFQITVRDTIAPVITMKDGSEGKLLIGLSRVLNFSEEEFLALFTATDNVTSTSDIVIDVEGDFIPSKVGEYDIKVVATDKAGNKGSYTCHVVVDADLPPVFILSDALIGATAETPLSSSQLQQIVANGLYADKEVLSVKLDDADYQANATKKGSYPVAYSVSYKAADGSVEEEDGTMTIRVDNSVEEEQPEEEKSAWQKFCDWWTNGWQCFCNWFRGVFTKGEWDCWITNEEWDKRFPVEAEVEDSTSESSDPQTSPIED